MNPAVKFSTVARDDRITNCVKVCPMSIPLTKAIYEENRETILHGLFGWLKR